MVDVAKTLVAEADAVGVPIEFSDKPLRPPDTQHPAPQNTNTWSRLMSWITARLRKR
jgi:hypothetical protein